MAKSSFWDDLGNALTRKAKGLSSKAENLYEIQKIRNKLSAQERMTEKLMMDIGKMIYTRYEHGEAVDGDPRPVEGASGSVMRRHIRQ